MNKALSLRQAAQRVGVHHATLAAESGGETNVKPLAVDAKRAASMCGVSRTHWYSLKASGRLPPPIRLGRRTLWRVEELKRWVDAGCPPQHRWTQMNGGR